MKSTVADLSVGSKIEAGRANAVQRHAVVYPNVTRNARERLAQKKRACADLFTTLDY